MKASSFALLGAKPAHVSLLGRRVVEALTASGVSLKSWIEGDAEAALPGDLHQPGPLPIGKSVRRCSRSQFNAESPVDFLLQLDQGPVPLTSAPLGVWRLTTASPGPLAFWDVYDGAFHLEIRLERVSADPQSVPLERRWIQIDRLSYRATLDRVVQEMVEMVVHVALCGPPKCAVPVTFPPHHCDWPTGLQQTILKLKLLARFAADQWKGIFFSEVWKVGIIDAPITEFLDMGYQPNIDWIPSPNRQKFIADPFLVRRDDGWLLLAEEFDFTTNRGRIVQEFSVDGRFTGQVQKAIEEPCHMSYPFPLAQEQELYCLPETHQQGKIFAWRWDATSHSWKDPKEVISGPILDPTPIFYENRWWMFATLKDNGVDSKLHLFYSDSVWGPWQPHSRNPVKVDVRSSRPGGMPFVEGGRLFRPAQDCSKHYGWRVVLNLVTRLTPTEFAEETFRVVDSDRFGVNGIHTLSGAGDRTVIDAWQPRFVPGRAIRVLTHKLRRVVGA